MAALKKKGETQNNAVVQTLAKFFFCPLLETFSVTSVNDKINSLVMARKVA